MKNLPKNTVQKGNSTDIDMSPYPHDVVIDEETVLQLNESLSRSRDLARKHNLTLVAHFIEMAIMDAVEHVGTVKVEVVLKSVK